MTPRFFGNLGWVPVARKPAKWTPAEEDALQWLINQGMTHIECATALRRSKKSVSGRASYHGITRQWPPARPCADKRGGVA